MEDPRSVAVIVSIVLAGGCSLERSGLARQSTSPVDAGTMVDAVAVDARGTRDGGPRPDGATNQPDDGGSIEPMDAGPPQGPDDWWDLEYAARLPIDVVDSAPALGEPIVVLVRLTESRLPREQVRGGGNTLRFALADGTELPFESERFDDRTEAILWVRLPTLAPQDGARVRFYLYFDHPSPSDGARPDLVWSEYLSVYHFATGPTGASNDVLDATGRHHGSSQGGMTLGNLVEAATGFGYLFDGFNDYVDMGAIAEFIVPENQSRSFSGWFNDNGPVLERGTILEQESRCRGYSLAIHDALLRARYAVAEDPTCFGASINSATVLRPTRAQLHHFMWVIDRSRGMMRLYVDGVSTVNASIPSTGPGGEGRFRLGANWEEAAVFDGILDEIRISPFARTADFAEAQYRSMGDDLLEYGAIERHRSGR